MYIDCHAYGDPDNLSGDPKSYVESCREHGIESIVLIEPLKRCLKAIEKFGDFVIPVAVINMDSATTKEVEDCIKSGCGGIHFIGPAAPYGDKRYWLLYEKIEELDAVALFHTGYLAFKEKEIQPIWMEHMRAAQVEVVARRFPDLKIIMAHFSNPWWEEAWKVSWSRKNIFADLCGGTTVHRSTKMWAEMFAPDGNLLESSIRKICFGSDATYFKDGEFPFESAIAFYNKIYDRIGLSNELREVVNSGNMRILFGLT